MAEMKLTDEMVKKLKGVMPFSTDSRHEFKLIIEDFPDEMCPTFVVRPFTNEEKQTAQRLANKTNSGKADNADGKKSEELVAACLRGWDNVWDIGTREKIIFKEATDGGCDRVLFEGLSEILKEYILREILKISSLTTDAKLSLG